MFLKDLPPKLLKAADYILQGPQHGSTAVLAPHKTSQNKKRQKYILFDQHKVNTISEKQRKNRTAKERQMLYNIQEKRTRDFFLVIFILFGFDRLNTQRIQEAEIIHVFFHCVCYGIASGGANLFN